MSLRDYYADEELFIARTCGRDDGTGPCDEVLVGDDRCPYHDEEVIDDASPRRAREVDGGSGVCWESPRGAPAGNRRRTSGLPHHLISTGGLA